MAHATLAKLRGPAEDIEIARGVSQNKLKSCGHDGLTYFGVYGGGIGEEWGIWGI